MKQSDAVKAAMEEPIEDSYRPIAWLPLSDSQVREIMQTLPDSVMDLHHEHCIDGCNEDAVWEHAMDNQSWMLTFFYCDQHSLPTLNVTRGVRRECEITPDAIRRHGGDTPELHEWIRNLIRAKGKGWHSHDCAYCFRVTGLSDASCTHKAGYTEICQRCINA